MLKVKIINLFKFIMVEVDIFDIANGVSLIGTCLGLFSRVPQVYRTYKSKSANDRSASKSQDRISSLMCLSSGSPRYCSKSFRLAISGKYRNIYAPKPILGAACEPISINVILEAGTPISLPSLSVSHRIPSDDEIALSILDLREDKSVSSPISS